MKTSTTFEQNLLEHDNEQLTTDDTHSSSNHISPEQTKQVVGKEGDYSSSFEEVDIRSPSSAKSSENTKFKSCIIMATDNASIQPHDLLRNHEFKSSKSSDIESGENTPFYEGGTLILDAQTSASTTTRVDKEPMPQNIE